MIRRNNFGERSVDRELLKSLVEVRGRGDFGGGGEWVYVRE